MNLKKVVIFTHIWLINPLLNLYPFLCIDVFYDNQSHIGNALHHHLYLWIWAISSALGFLYLSLIIWKKRNYSVSILIHSLLCVGMFVSCIIPYAQTVKTWINDLHIWLAITCVGGFIGEWLYYFYQRGLQTLYEKLLVIAFIFCTFLLLAPGHITSSTEISFSFLVNVVLYLMAFSDNHGKIGA